MGSAPTPYMVTVDFSGYSIAWGSGLTTLCGKDFLAIADRHKIMVLNHGSIALFCGISAYQCPAASTFPSQPRTLHPRSNGLLILMFMAVTALKRTQYYLDLTGSGKIALLSVEIG